MDAWLDYLKEKLGSNIFGILITLVAGAAILYWTTNFFVTTETFSHEKEDMISQVKQGDVRNSIEIADLKLSSAWSEKIKLENFIDMEQDGKCTDRQRIRIEELNRIISELTMKKEMLYQKVLEKR